MKATVHIAAATADDCPAIASVHVASWQHAYRHLLRPAYLDALSVERREASWRQVLAQGNAELLVARVDGEVAGFASFGACRDQDAPAGRGELWALYASPRVWTQGVGLGLWQAARTRLAARGFHQASLWVLAGNTRAIRFYETVGFAPDAASAKDFELGGALVREIRYIARLDAATHAP